MLIKVAGLHYCANTATDIIQLINLAMDEYDRDSWESWRDELVERTTSMPKDSGFMKSKEKSWCLWYNGEKPSLVNTYFETSGDTRPFIMEPGFEKCLVDMSFDKKEDADRKYEELKAISIAGIDEEIEELKLLKKKKMLG